MEGLVIVTEGVRYANLEKNRSSLGETIWSEHPHP